MLGSSKQLIKVAAKVAVLLAFIGFFSTKAYAQLGGKAPDITVQPVGVSVQNGGTAVLTSTATSLTAATFTWYLDGQKLTNSKASVANVMVPLVGTVSTLTIVGVDPSLAGTYSVEVKNSAGTTISSNATLVVLGTVVTNTVSTVTNTVSFVASETKLTTSGFKLQLSVPIGSNVVIHASSDLSHWSPISTNTSTTGTVTVTDTEALHVTSRFYRAEIR